MKTFRDSSIRVKVLIVTVATIAAALVLAGFGIVLADAILYRQSLRRDLMTLSMIIADNSSAALAFNDPEAAMQTLAALHAREHLESACLFRNDGSILAQYQRQSGLGCAPPRQAEDMTFSGDVLTVSRPVFVKNVRLGTLTLSYDLAEIGERTRLFAATVAAVFLAASLLALLLSARLRAAITRPISALVHASSTVSRTGDYSIRAEKFAEDELGQLADRFNQMLSGIQSRDRDLKQALAGREAALREAEAERERFHFLAESMPQKIFTATPAGAVDYFNRQWMEFTGIAFEQISDWGWSQFVHPDEIEENARAWRHAVETGEPLRIEHRFLRADGMYRWHLSRAVAMRDPSGRVIMWIGSSTEIHEQKEKEEELRRANADLEQFAYSASHDLQEPIRNVAVYSDLVARRYSTLLDEEGKQFLVFLQEGGARLKTLVTDLLAYTRASMVELVQTPVDAEAALKNSLANLAEAIRESGAQVSYDPLPVVSIGEAHLEQIFQNLISNALKYRKDAPPEIHVSAKKIGAEWCFFVKDNGIGIDPRYKEKIFGLFKRLHHTEFSGTGIGLAICKRVVERYGGRIWVDSVLGRGSTFLFTIPERTLAGQPASVQSSAG